MLMEYFQKCKYSVNYVGYSKMCKCVLGGGRACSTPGRQSKLMREGGRGHQCHVMNCFGTSKNVQNILKYLNTTVGNWAGSRVGMR